MQFSERLKAIQFIRPNAQFVLTGDDLTWCDEEQTEPTEAEIKAGWVAYQAKVKADKADAAAKKATLEAKLVALGLDLDDLRALGL